VIETCDALEDACQETSAEEEIRDVQQAMEVAMLDLEQALRDALNRAV